jgi:nucleotide-binding universal stress UspA family protein
VAERGDRPGGSALLCWDGSAEAEQAIHGAAGILGEGHQGVVLVVHGSTEPLRGFLSGASGAAAPRMDVTEAEQLVERGTRVAREAGFDAVGMRVSSPRGTARVISATADERGSDVIVMGQRRRSATGALVLGSVAREVLGPAHRPVILVGPCQARRERV